MEIRKNIYVCDKGHRNITVDVDVGVTPFMIGCRHPDCDLIARSLFYPKRITEEAEYEWYMPNALELKQLKKCSQDEYEHAKGGGLSIRRRTDKEPICHIKANE